MKINRVFTVLVFLAIVVSLMFGTPGLSAYAQEILTETPTETPTETHTPTPTETPTPEPTASDTPEPAGSPTPTATVEGLPAETATQTPTLELTLTPEGTLTETPTLTPTETPTETPEPALWRLEYDLFYPDAFVNSMGGAAVMDADLQGFIQNTLSGEDADYSLTQLPADGGTTFLLMIEGRGGYEQFRRIYLGPLKARFGTTGGVTRIQINDKGKGGKDWKLALDAQFSTGYSWKVVDKKDVDENRGSTRQERGGPLGSRGRQEFFFTPGKGKGRSVSLIYNAPFESGQAPTRRIDLDFPIDQDLLLASDEVQPELAASEPPPLESDSSPDLAMGALPATFDWRASGYVSPIRHQGICGSCYAFATVGVMESAMLINDISADLSEQFLVSCTQDYNNGCGGGYPDSHKYHVSTVAQKQTAAGAVLEADMPYVQRYTAEEGACYQVQHPYQLMSWYRISPTWNTTPPVEDIKNAIFTKGPVATSICSQSAFDNYNGGIFTTNESCGTARTNHAVILVGWIEDSNHGTVWIMKNSWGINWGDSGYMYVKAGTSNIGNNATYVVYQPLPDPLAPSVSYLDTLNHTADNRLDMNEAVTVDVRNLIVNFDERMYTNNGVNDVATLSNYTLTDLGPNGVPGGGDDLNVPFTSASYLPDARKLTLVINNGAVLPNAVYQFRISGSGTVMDEGGSRLDGDKDGYAGGDFIFTFSVAKKPAAPLLSSPASGSLTNIRTTTLAWQPSALAASYELSIALDSAFTKVIYSNNAITGTSYTPPAMADGKYYWRVRELNRFGYPGSWSTVWNLSVDTLAPAIPKLDKPADLSASRDVPVFYWLAASGAKYYRLRLTDTLGGERYTSADLTVLNHRPPEQDLGVLLWQVSSGDAAGNWSAWSAPRSLLIRPKIPAAPILLAPANGLPMRGRTPTLDWNDVPWAASYEFQVSKVNTFTSLSQAGNPPASQFTLVSLDDGKYYWRVRAYNIDGEKGSWSAIRSFTIDNVAPKPPALYTPANNKINKGTPTYKWTKSSGASRYEFRYTTPQGAMLYTSPELSVLYHKPPTQPIGHYLWQVRARDAAGNWSDWSAARAIEIMAPIPAAPKLSLPANKSSSTDTTPTLSWLAANYATGYELQIARTYTFKTSSVAAQPTVNGATQYTTSPLPAGVTYYWRARSINVYGEKGAWSGYRSFKVTP